MLFFKWIFFSISISVFLLNQGLSSNSIEKISNNNNNNNKLSLADRSREINKMNFNMCFFNKSHSSVLLQIQLKLFYRSTNFLITISQITQSQITQ